MPADAPVYNLTGKNTNTYRPDYSVRSEASSGRGFNHGQSNKSNQQLNNPRDSICKTAALESDEFIELGLLEKEFRKAYQINDGDSAGSGSSELDIFSNLRNRLKIKINNEKHLCDKHLVADVRQRNESLEEVLRYFYVMHQIEFGNQNIEERTQRPEDEAVNSIISALGFRTVNSKQCKPIQRSLNTQHNEEIEQTAPDPIFSFNYESQGGSKWHTEVFSMSIFSQNRGRRSMIISAPSAESDPYMLITFGNERSMRHQIRPSRNKKEDNLLKVMIAKQKQRGLKTLIVAKKGLSAEQVLTYTKEYSKISSSARDQIEDLESLATQIECDLEFVGCIGLRDSIREEAVSLTKQLKQSHIEMSIMSGDELENCVTVVNKLGISFIDIQNSSSFYWVHSESEKEIMQEFRRIFTKIHEVLQNESYKEIESLLKLEKEQLNPEMEAQKTLKAENDNPSQKTDIELDRPGVTFETIHKFKKSLLLSGASLEHIMSSKILTDHLSAVLCASGTVIGYGLRPKHKAFLTDLLINSGEVVLAVGDGFNDIGMLSRASFGVQISNKNVPLIFGDIVVTSLSNIAPLMYDHGFPLKKNIVLSVVLIVWIGVNLAFSSLFISYFTFFYFPIVMSGVLAIGLNVFYFLIIIFVLANSTYDKSLMNKFSVIYRENMILAENIPKIILAFFLLSVVESVLWVIPIVYYMSFDLNKNGYVFSLENINAYYAYMLALSICVKLAIILSRFTFRNLAMIMLPTFAVYSVMLVGQSLVASPCMWKFVSEFEFSSHTFTLIMLTIAIGYIDYIVVTIFKKRFFNPVSGLFDKYSKEDSEVLTNKKVMEYISSKSNFSKNQLFLQIIYNIKKHFTDKQFMDSSLARIINLDFHHSNMGLTRFTNKIVDEDERKRFLRYISKKNNERSAKYFISAMILASGVEWAILALGKKTSWPAALDSIAPYFCISMIGNLVMTLLRPKYVYHTMFGILYLIEALIYCSW
jgi:magnesium-transporting ATPase (P-type)